MDRIWIEKFKNEIGEMYPQRRKHIRKARERINNKEFTLISSNCMGGLIYHNLGLKFNSPTINMQMYTNEYYNFVMNLEEYLSKEIIFIPSFLVFPLSASFSYYIKVRKKRQE